MDEMGELLVISERGAFEPPELWRDFYLPLKERIENAEDDSSLVDILHGSPIFRGSLLVLMDIERPRPAGLTNSLGVEIDPAYVISEIDGKIRALSPEMFGRVRVPNSIKNNLFETSYDFESADATRGFQDPTFDFAIDWEDDLGTAQEFFASWGRLRDLVEVRDAQDADVNEMYLGLLLVSYLYHRRLYEEAGIDSLEKFWTQYSLDRRQGRATRSLDDVSWTVRVRGVARPDEDPGEWVEPIVVPVPLPRPPPPPPPPDLGEERRTIEIGRAETVIKQEVAAIHEYRVLRTEWQADPTGDVSLEELLAIKGALDVSAKDADILAKRIRAVFREGREWKYSEDPELARIVTWHRLHAKAYAAEFLSGFASLREGPPISGGRDDELKNITLS